MKITTGDVVLWLELSGRSEISHRQAEGIRPYRQSVSQAGNRATLNLALKMDKDIFLKRRQIELLDLFDALAPYRLVAEIAIYHPAKAQLACREFPPRLLNCLCALGAELKIVSYLSA